MEITWYSKQNFDAVIQYLYSTNCELVASSEVLDTFVSLGSGASYSALKDNDGIPIGYFMDNKLIFREGGLGWRLSAES